MSLLAIYAGCLVLGGMIVGASAFSGGDDSDGDHGGDGHAGDSEAGGHEAGHEVEGAEGAEGDHAHSHHGPPGIGSSDFVATIISVRFWSFALASFGLAGTLLTLLGAHESLTLGFSIALGALVGGGVTTIMRRLSRQRVGADLSTGRLAGQEGIVVLAMEPGKPGKIRMDHQGQRLDMIATTTDRRIERGERVLVVEMKGGSAVVTPTQPVQPPRLRTTD